jgi:hypothetical protein
MSMSRDSRIGLPLSSDSSTAKSARVLLDVPRDGVEVARAAVAAERAPAGSAARAARTAASTSAASALRDARERLRPSPG